jgi:hypothetical protein
MEFNKVKRRRPLSLQRGSLFCVELPASRPRDHHFKGIVQMTLPKSVELRWHCEGFLLDRHLE